VTSQPRYVSPLRYPGGKTAMARWLAGMFGQQAGDLPVEVWVEPFAGGAGAALTLLEQSAVEEAWLVEVNDGIAAFWQSVVDDGETLAAAVERTEPTLELFDQSRAKLGDPSTADRFGLGFAAFVVNRCSRSGMVSATSGPIGGRTQTGRWRVDARFNAAGLAERIRRLHAMRSRLRVFHGDGISFVEGLDGSGVGDEVVVFADPPYVREGNRLYANGFDERAHVRLAEALNRTRCRWALTYDDEPVVSDRFYPHRRVLAYACRNSANRARVATEFLVLSDNVDVRGLGAPIDGLGARWVRAEPCAAQVGACDA